MIRTVLVMVVGLPGTGKSFFIDKVNENLRYKSLGMDIARQELGVNTVKPEVNSDVALWLYYTLDRVLHYTNNAIIESIYKSRLGREEVYNIAQKLNVKILVVECFCEKETALKRIQSRPSMVGNFLPSNDPNVYFKYESIWEDVENDLKVGNDISFIRYNSEKNYFADVRIDPSIQIFVEKLKRLF